MDRLKNEWEIGHGFETEIISYRDALQLKKGIGPR